MNRRDFFQVFIGGASLLTLATTLKSNTANAEERRRGGGAAADGKPVLVDPASPTAKQVNYAHKHSDVTDKTVQLDRQGVKWADQKCLNCNFYQVRAKDNKIGAMTVGGCTMPFAAGKVVAEAGWCNTWAKK